MKRTILTMLIAFALLITAGAASAEVLTVTNGDYPCGDLIIDVTYGDVNTTTGEADITVAFNWLNESKYGVTTDPKLLEVYLNMASGVELMGTDPTYNNETLGSYKADGMDYFNMRIYESDAAVGTLIIHLMGSPVTATTAEDFLEMNADGKTIAVHVGSLGSTGFSMWVTNGDCGGGNTTGNDIPEFPTIALPIAAIIGLAFVMQRKKE